MNKSRLYEQNKKSLQFNYRNETQKLRSAMFAREENRQLLGSNFAI